MTFNWSSTVREEHTTSILIESRGRIPPDSGDYQIEQVMPTKLSRQFLGKSFPRLKTSKLTTPRSLERAWRMAGMLLSCYCRSNCWSKHVIYQARSLTRYVDITIKRRKNTTVHSHGDCWLPVKTFCSLEEVVISQLYLRSRTFLLCAIAWALIRMKKLVTATGYFHGSQKLQTESSPSFVSKSWSSTAVQYMHIWEEHHISVWSLKGSCSVRKGHGRWPSTDVNAKDDRYVLGVTEPNFFYRLLQTKSVDDPIESFAFQR